MPLTSLDTMRSDLAVNSRGLTRLKLMVGGTNPAAYPTGIKLHYVMILISFCYPKNMDWQRGKHIVTVAGMPIGLLVAGLAAHETH